MEKIKNPGSDDDLDFLIELRKRLIKEMQEGEENEEETESPPQVTQTPGVPAEGNSPYAMGDCKEENRAPLAFALPTPAPMRQVSFRAIGSADAHPTDRPWTLSSAGMVAEMLLSGTNLSILSGGQDNRQNTPEANIPKLG